MKVKEAIKILADLDMDAELVIREYGEPMYVCGMSVCSENDKYVEGFILEGNKVLIESC